MITDYKSAILSVNVVDGPSEGDVRPTRLQPDQGGRVGDCSLWGAGPGDIEPVPGRGGVTAVPVVDVLLVVWVESFSFELLPVTDQIAAKPLRQAAIAADIEPLSAAAAADTTTLTVEFVRSGRTISCLADTNVLDAALPPGCDHRRRAARVCTTPARPSCSTDRSTCSTTEGSDPKRLRRTRS